MSDLIQERLKSILLDHYHCTFFLPLLGFGDDKLLPNDILSKSYPYSDELDIHDAEAFHYFTPTLRDIIFDRAEGGKNLQPIKEWHLSREMLSDWRLELLPSKEQKKAIDKGEMDRLMVHQTVIFQSVRLYRYFNGIYLLAFTVEPKVLHSLKEATDVSLFNNPTQYWDEVAEDDPHRSQYQALQLEAWLRFTRLARQLYPTFTEQWNEEKIAPLSFSTPEMTEPLLVLDKEVPTLLPKSAEHLSPMIVYLVQQFFAEPIEAVLKERIRLFDDRMFVSVAYGLAGKKHESLDKIKALIATTDRFADTWAEMDGYVYDKKATEGYLNGTEFGLWSRMGGHYIYNEMVNAYLYNGWFFRNIIATKHIPYIYDRMLIQALFYQASLRHYDHEITQKTTLLLDKGEQAIDEILQQRKHFIQFTNQYWFKDVTNQMQGKMIFRLQQQGLELDEYYHALQDEIGRTNDYLQVLNENRAAQEANRLANEANLSGQRANRFAKIGVLLAFIAAFSVFNDVFKTENSLWQWIVENRLGGCSVKSVKDSACSDVGVRFALVIIIGLLIGAVSLAWNPVWEKLKKRFS